MCAALARVYVGYGPMKKQEVLRRLNTFTLKGSPIDHLNEFDDIVASLEDVSVVRPLDELALIFLKSV